MDDMFIKSRKMGDHITDVDEAFRILKYYNMKLNPSKCEFRVFSGNFLGFMVSQRGTEVSLYKIEVVLYMESPKTIKEVQRLAGNVTALNKFI